MPYSTKEQRAAHARGYYHAHTEKARARQRAYEQTPEAKEKQRLRKLKFDLAHPQYLTKRRMRLLEAEAGRPRPTICEACGNDQREIHFDHCHKTGVFRGWLCRDCNQALGFVKDDPIRLLQLIKYLEQASPDTGASPL
jgi:hypothetical protein